MGRNFPQILVLVKISGKCQFGSKICKYVDLIKNFQPKFGQICRKSWFWSKLSKMLDFAKKKLKNLDFGHKGRKFSILVKTYQNVDFRRNCRKYWLYSKFSKNVDLGQNFQISRFWSKLSKNFDFGQYFWKSRFWSNLWKSRFRTKLQKMLIIVKICEKCRFGSKFINISILVIIVG